MTAATKSSTTPRTPWNRAHKPSTTPHGLPAARTPASVGQSAPPRLTPSVRPPAHQDVPRSPSPNYFGLVVEGGGGNPTDSNAGLHAKKNWKSPSSSIQSKASPKSPATIPHDSNPEYEEFRKQSEAYAFNLSQRNFSGLSQYSNAPPTSPLARRPMGNIVGMTISPNQDGISPKHPAEPESDAMEVDGEAKTGDKKQADGKGQLGFFDVPRNETPEQVQDIGALHQDRLSNIDERHPRLSLPQNRVAQPSPPLHSPPKRAETLPSSTKTDGPTLVDPANLEGLLGSSSHERVLLLDLRVSPQFSQSRIKGSLNLCIPTTLLKRPSFNLHRLTDTFTDKDEKARFSKWREMGYIIVYDASSTTLKDALACVNTLKKFTNEGWQGNAFIIRGGFKSAATAIPRLVERASAGVESDSAKKLSIQSGNDVMPVAGGCPMPATKSAANPFFGNIRQNMDLIGGVGQVPVNIPSALGPRGFEALPAWLRAAAAEEDKGKAASETFLQIEKEEQSRMQKALSGHVSYGTPAAESDKGIQIAGIEKGTKNRYKDMLPYDHARVKLQNSDESECDYINASHVTTAWSNKRYIATQAPIPATFQDFWRVVWEQNVRVLVMLTAESEGNQRKCHPYWVSDDYGPMKIKSLSEKRISLQQPDTLAANLKKSHLGSPLEKPAAASRRRATNPHGAAAAEAARDSGPSAEATEPAHVTVRTLTLSHSAFPFEPMRQIVQIQYAQWPDFGTPAHPTDLLGLVELTNSYARQSREGKTNPQLPASENDPPILVHCSAGCGRTGTFCTIDSAIDMLKRQRVKQLSDASTRNEDEMEIDSQSWELRDDTDLVKKAVDDFRLQRLSMVQTLKQFVLCYETVIEWLIKENPEKFRRESLRRSFHG